jgi:uncharacterized protein (DUF433 family)
MDARVAASVLGRYNTAMKQAKRKPARPQRRKCPPTDPSLTLVRDPEICGGAPTFAGTRIGVHDVVGYAQVYGGDLDRVRKEALPYLSEGQIQAALEWYREHPDEIDDLLRRRREFYEQGLAGSPMAR